MADYSQLSALRNVARACKAEMETISKTDIDARRAILERHLEPLKIRFGMKKVDLQVEIYHLTCEKR